MDFVYRRAYRGAIKAVIFDWAGTTVDYGCMAPAAVFVEVFKRHGVEPTMQQAREPMGLHKRDHLRAMCQMEPIALAWQAKHGQRPTDYCIETLFNEFIPLQLEAIKRHADLIPGTVETVKALRARGLKIGSTTGYNNAMLDSLAAEAAKAGYAPEVAVCAADVPAGRPAPWMALEAAKQLGVYPLEAIVKVGDTPSDIGEGLNAGMWTIGIVDHGNEVGLTQADFEALPAAARSAVTQRARDRLATAGAHYVVATIADVPATVEAINLRLAQGERP